MFSRERIIRRRSIKMDTAKAALKFGISKRRVEALCSEGRIFGAKKVKGKWQIPSSAVKPADERSVFVVPDDQLSIFDAMGRDKKTTLDRAEVCRALSVSPTTLKNWIRLGKIMTGPDGSTFDKKYISSLSRSMKKRDDGRLRSRRNKNKKAGRSLYSDYIGTDANKDAVKVLGARLPVLSRSEIRSVLAGCATRLYLLSLGKSPESDAASHLNASGYDGEFSSLLRDLTGEKERRNSFSDAFSAGLSSGLVFVPWEDTLGFVYLSLCDVSERKQTGLYFTPGNIAQKTLDLIEETCGMTRGSTIDPCCGTGNFLMSLAKRGADVRSLHGADIDEVSVEIARINLFLNDHSLPADRLREMVVRTDSLLGKKSGAFSLVVGNPPWGYQFTEKQLHSLSEKYASADKTGAESYDLFIERGIDLLADGGRLAYVVPEAFLNVASHGAARDKVRADASVSFVSFVGNVFSDVQCPAVLLGLEKRKGGDVTGCLVERDGKRFRIGEGRMPFSDGSVFNTDDEECAALRKISNVKNARFLKDHAKFALGIVTGNNKEFLSDRDATGYEPVLRGTDVFRFRTTPPTATIRFEPEHFQQCAPEAIFRAGEKLVYRFICDSPVFAYDADGTLSLNSCNILIPQIKGLGIKYVLAVLNSSAVSFFLDKKYKSVKLLRTHLESVPIPPVNGEVSSRIEKLVDLLIDGAGRAEYKELDSIISDLYDLSDEEKKAVEKSVAAKKSYLL